MSIEQMTRVDEGGNVRLLQPKIITAQVVAERMAARSEVGEIVERVSLIDRVTDRINNFFDGQAPAELAPAAIEPKPEKVNNRQSPWKKVTALAMGAVSVFTAVGGGSAIATAQSAETVQAPATSTAQADSETEGDWWDNFPTIDGQTIAFEDMPVEIRAEITNIAVEEGVAQDDAIELARGGIVAAQGIADQAAREDYSERVNPNTNYLGPRLDHETVEGTIADLRERSEHDAKVLATLAYELREIETGDQLFTEMHLDEVNRFVDDLNNDPELRRAIHANVWALLDATEARLDTISGPTRSVYVDNGEIMFWETSRDGDIVIVFETADGEKARFLIKCGGQSVERIEDTPSQPETPVVETPPETPSDTVPPTDTIPPSDTVPPNTTVPPVTTTTAPPPPVTTTTAPPVTTTTAPPVTTTTPPVTHTTVTGPPGGVIIENQNTSNNTVSSTITTGSNR